MTHQIWTRVFVAGLILLGDGVYASEINNNDDLDAVTGNSIFQIALPAVPDKGGTKWQAFIPGTNTTGTTYHPASPAISAVSHSVSATHTYHPSNPRAPPIPAD